MTIVVVATLLMGSAHPLHLSHCNLCGGVAGLGVAVALGLWGSGTGRRRRSRLTFVFDLHYRGSCSPKVAS